MIRTYQYKLYPNKSQAKTLERWMGSCCWVFNHALAKRKKAWHRRREVVTYNDQQNTLTKIRESNELIRSCPVQFCRDALRRVDAGMNAFFQRVKAGKKHGYPRFKPKRSYNSMESRAAGKYLHGDRFRIPNLGLIRCRGRLLPTGIQKGIRVIKRATGWYAQIVLSDGRIPVQSQNTKAIGIDVGLTSFATLSDGSKVDNPRFYEKSQRKLASLQRRVSRRIKGSHRRLKAIDAVVRNHEITARKRRAFCHKLSTRMVRDYGLIGVEKLNIEGLKRSTFGKSISDASWGQFMAMLAYKAESAGSQVIAVDPRYTSQTCPDCGNVKSKKLSERTHSCACGLVCDRDHAAARMVLARALELAGAKRSLRESTAVLELGVPGQVGPSKREVLSIHQDTFQ